MAVQRRVGIFEELAGKGQARVSAMHQAATEKRLTYIIYNFYGETKRARKLDPVDFSAEHLATLRTGFFDDQNRLAFVDPGWKCVWVGAGEEKAVFLVVDNENRAFALELLVKDGYQNGRLIDGYYLADLQLSQVAGRKRDPRCALSLVYSGQAKAREFIFGETIAGPPLNNMRPTGNRSRRVINALSWNWAKSIIFPGYSKIQQKYRDAHEANVAIELIPLPNPEGKSHFLMPVPLLAHDKRLHWYFYRLTPIDVRTVGS